MACRRAPILAGIVLCLAASYASGQEPVSPDAPTRSGVTGSAPIASSPAIPSYALELLGLVAPGPQQGPVTLTPSLSVSEEYNDNIFADNQVRRWDFITSFSPALTLVVNRPQYQLSAGYSFGADIYARDSSLSNAFNRQNLVANGSYRVAPGLTLNASESFAYNRDTALVTPQAFSTGRQEAWSNVITPSLMWQMTARDSLNLSASYGLLRYGGVGSGINSDTYGAETTVTHAFTPRLSGSVGYAFTYLSIDAQGQDDAMTHTPLVGLSYQLTQTLTATARGGPAITLVGNDTIVTPAVVASLVQRFSFGSASVQYARGVGVAAGFGGVNDTQTIAGALTLSGLERGLLIVLTPGYSFSDSLGSQQTAQGDIQTFTLGLGVTYQVARYATVFGGYTLLRQRTGGPSTTQADVDQNRIRFGLQFGYPINFD